MGYGLLGGISEGVQSGAQSYDDQQKKQNDQKKAIKNRLSNMSDVSKEKLGPKKTITPAPEKAIA